ncbi:unnamed protein product [Parnassius mnemosyne]|uniref:Peptidase C1A papain C-terminal domain-containing protein n=1 Tax=Parnassius mnemosyne TaxID=213953 RepID=A0AAV1L6C4_9NEOP
MSIVSSIWDFSSSNIVFCKNKIYQMNHAVLVVGYGTFNGQRYWLVKNSWSNRWGNDGYVLMSSRDNNCGVENAPAYVLI